MMNSSGSKWGIIQNRLASISYKLYGSCSEICRMITLTFFTTTTTQNVWTFSHQQHTLTQQHLLQSILNCTFGKVESGQRSVTTENRSWSHLLLSTKWESITSCIISLHTKLHARLKQPLPCGYLCSVIGDIPNSWSKQLPTSLADFMEFPVASTTTSTTTSDLVNTIMHSHWCTVALSLLKLVSLSMIIRPRLLPATFDSDNSAQ